MVRTEAGEFVSKFFVLLGFDGYYVSLENG
jgi:hypothetical protein